MDSKESILIVDDDESIRRTLTLIFRKEGYEIETAETGQEAIEKAQGRFFNLALLDIKLPDIEGIELIEPLREMHPDMAAIMITAYATIDNAVKALNRGASAYIIKTLGMDEVLAAIRGCLEKQRLIIENRRLYQVVQQELAERKQAEEALRRSEERFRELANLLPQTVFEIDLKGNFTFVNRYGLEYLGYTQEYLDEGLNTLQLFIPEDRERVQENIQRILSGDKQTGNEYTALRKDGSTFPVIIYSSLIIHENKPVGLRGIIVDITERKQMEEELERRVEQRTKELKVTQAQLFQTSKLANLGEMATGLAHEMNQPLAGISLSATYLRKLMVMGKLSQEEIELGLNDIESSVKRMSRIINHVRTFARQETFEFIQVDVNQTIAEALGLLGEQLRLHKIEVVEDLSSDLPKIVGEPYQLEQVWINLIINARDAVDEKGEQISGGRLQIADYKKNINISTTYNPESKFVEISVGDNGIGMSEEVKPRVFEPFFTTKEVGTATGLGLSICYGIIESHKGQMEVESKEGEGTAVKVTLKLEVDDD